MSDTTASTNTTTTPSDTGTPSQTDTDSGSLSLTNTTSPTSPPVSPTSPTGTPTTSILTSPSLTVSPSTFLSTSDGVVYTETVNVTSTVPAGSTITTTPPPSTSNDTRTGAIAGGVVGGIAAILIAGFAIWLIRKKARERRLKDEFDGNFDPSRTTGPSLPRVSFNGGDLIAGNGVAGAEEEDDGVGGRLAGSSIGGGVVTPFPAGHVYPQMQQYGGHTPISPTTTGTGSFYYPGAAPSVTSSGGARTATTTSYPNPMSTKEREALGGHFTVANPGPYASGSGGGGLPNPHSPTGSGVVVHQDGGRIEEETEGMNEIPPLYETIPQNR